MAERYEILIDFSKYKTGQRVVLQNLSNENNRDFDHTNKVMAFDVVDDAFNATDPTARTLPTVLYPNNPVMALTEKQSVKSRYFRLQRIGETWSINGRSWRDVIASGYTYVEANPRLNDVEIWEIENKSGGWFHPTHIHLVDFKILSRNGRAPFPHELGPKDVVYVGENEKVRLLMRFGPHRGKYMMHCHNLPHEDHDMMTQFSVGMPTEPNFHEPLSDPGKYDDLVD
jgi:FtsP/CotA-like multicopper oxidase with cupredoxin domain